MSASGPPTGLPSHAGPAASGFRYPIRPANFQDAGTIAQLTLPYVYWRLTVGGIQNQFRPGDRMDK